MTQWNPLDEPRDIAFVEGVPTPGYCEVTGASSPRKWDEADGYGFSGGLLIFHGLPLCKFSLKLTLYDTDDWNDWHAFRPLVMRPPKLVRPRALAIDHPQLAELGVASMVVADVAQATQIDHGVWLIEIPCIEWRQLTAAGVSKPEGTEPAEQSETQKEIERVTALNKRLLEQASKLGGVFGGGAALLGGPSEPPQQNSSGDSSVGTSSGARGL